MEAKDVKAAPLSVCRSHPIFPDQPDNTVVEQSRASYLRRQTALQMGLPKGPAAHSKSFEKWQ